MYLFIIQFSSFLEQISFKLLIINEKSRIYSAVKTIFSILTIPFDVDISACELVILFYHFVFGLLSAFTPNEHLHLRKAIVRVIHFNLELPIILLATISKRDNVVLRGQGFDNDLDVDVFVELW